MLKVRRKEIAVLMSFFILALLFCLKKAAVVVENINLENLLDVCENAAYLVLPVSIVMSKKYKQKEFFVIIMIAILGLIVRFHTGYGWVLYLVLILAASKDVPFDKVCKVIFYGLLIGTIFILIMYVLGISDAGIKRRGYLGYGFSHPNNFSGVIMIMCYIHAYLNRKSKRWESLWLIVAAIFNYFILGNRSVTVLLIAYPILLTIMRYLYKNEYREKYRHIKNILVMTFPICELLSISTAILYITIPFLQRLSLLLNSRIFEAYYNLNYFGCSLFGQMTNYTEYTYDPTRDMYFHYNVLDNAYMGILIEMGIIAAVIWGIIHVLLARKLNAQREIELLTIYILCALYGWMESSYRIVFVDFTLLFLLTSSNMSEQTYGKLERIGKNEFD